MNKEILTVYVLHSIKYDKIYIGFTNNLIQRFHSHNSLSTKGYTIKFRPWVVVHAEYFGRKGVAMKREKQLKSSRGRHFIWNKINIK